MTSKQRRALGASGLAPGIIKLLTEALTSDVRERVYMPAHGFVVGDWVYRASGTWAKADRDAVASFADGVVSRVDNVDEFLVTSGGRVGGLSGLTEDAVYYLSSTAGAMTSTAPTSGNVQIVGKAISANWFRVQMQTQVVPAQTVTGDLTHEGTNIGLHSATPVPQASAYTQTYATADKTHENMTSADLSIVGTSGGWGYADEAEANSVQTEVNALRADLIDLKQLVNALIDDLQLRGDIG